MNLHSVPDGCSKPLDILDFLEIPDVLGILDTLGVLHFLGIIRVLHVLDVGLCFFQKNNMWIRYHVVLARRLEPARRGPAHSKEYDKLCFFRTVSILLTLMTVPKSGKLWCPGRS